MRFAGDLFGNELEQQDNLIAMAYTNKDKAEDKILLQQLTTGQLGSGPNIDDAIKKITDRLMGAPGSRIGY